MKFFNDEKSYYKASHNDNNDLICCDCGIEYKHVCDLIIDDNLWNQITPTSKFDPDAGVLCPTCILNRLAELGLYVTPYTPKFQNGSKKIDGKFEWEEGD